MRTKRLTCARARSLYDRLVFAVEIAITPETVQITVQVEIAVELLRGRQARQTQARPQPSLRLTVK